MFAYGFEQAVVSEPAIANDRHGHTDKVVGQLQEHLGGLFQLCVKRGGFAGDTHII